MRERKFISNLYKQLLSFILSFGVLCGAFSFPARASSDAVFFAERFGAAVSRMDFLANFPSTKADVQIPNCPDTNGVLRGKGKIIVTGTSAAKKVTTTEVEITGYVNDAAELTHFDMAGATTETDANGGNAKRISVAVEENKIGAGDAVQKELDRTGRTMFSSEQSAADAATAERLSDAARTAVKAIFEEAAAKFRAARSAWRSGACVEVKLTAPKTRLSPGEKVIVSAESRHKLEKLLINAKLVKKEATESATPDELPPGTPRARFTLTAPKTPGQKAMIAIESISKRGIGVGRLEFAETSPVAVVRNPPPSKKPPVKTPPNKQCNAPWTGKITVVKSEREEPPGSPGGRLLRHVRSKEETFNIEYNLIGEQDTTGNLVNGYFAEAQMNYREMRYEERNYAEGKMSCDKRIISSPETNIMEILTTDSSSKRLTVYVAAYSSYDKGILTFGSPEINAESIITRTYKTSCPSYDKVNSSVDRSSNIGIPSPSFEIEIPLDDKRNYSLSGSKTIQNSDGSQTLVTWNLTRNCQ